MTDTARAARGPSWARLVGVVAPLAVLAAGIAGSAAAYSFEEDRHDNEVEARFALVDDDVQDQVQSLVDAQIAAAESTAAALATDPDMTRDQFARFAAGMQRHYTSLLGLGYIRRVAASELDTFVAAARRDGAPDFPTVDAAGRDSLAVLLYNEPASRLRSSWGFDVSTVPDAAEALARAVEAGGAVLSDRLVLAVDLTLPSDEQPAGYVAYVPVFAPGAPVDTLAEREAALVGWANLPFRAQDLLDQVRVPVGIELSLDDGTGPAAFVAGGGATTMHSRQAVAALDQRWWVDLDATPAFAAEVPDRSGLAAAVTLSLTVLLAALVLLLSRANRSWTSAAERTARSLAGSEQRLRATIAGAPDLILVVGPDGTIGSASERAMELVGTPPEDLVGRFADDVIEGWSGAGGSDRDVAVRRPDGTRVPVEVTLRTLTDGEDAGAVVAIVRDVTARRKDEAAAALLSSIVTSTDDAIITVGPDGTITSWNGGAERLYGWTSSAAVGQPVTLLADPGATGGDTVLIDLAHGESVFHRSARHRRADGETVEVSVTASLLPGRLGQPGGTSLIVRDVTSEVRSRAALAAYADELERSNRDLARSNRDLEEFAAIVSHDLSEPLRVVGGYADLLAHRYTIGRPLDRSGLEYLEAVSRGVERMRQLIEGLLELSRLRAESTRTGPVELDDVLTTALANLQSALADSGAAVQIEPLPAVWGDRAQLVQLFQNLLANAIRFHRPGVAPKVTVRAEPAAQDSRWTIAVSDNGIGIAPEHQDRIFGLFRRLHSTDRYPGTGIGLAVCRRVMDLHGGDLEVESTPGVGSTFRFTLAAADAPHGADAAAPFHREVVGS